MVQKSTEIWNEVIEKVKKKLYVKKMDIRSNSTQKSALDVRVA